MILKNRKRFKRGNVVKWNQSLWIVEDDITSKSPEGKVKRKVHLISADCTNVSACPTSEWPDDEPRRDLIS